MSPEDFKAARLALGLTQQQLADEWGLGPEGRRTVRRWETGERAMNPLAVYCIKLMLEMRNTK